MVRDRRDTLRVLAAVLLPLASGRARATQDACDPGLPRLPGHPLGYRARAGRCEGLYAREVAAGSLRIVGYGPQLIDFDPRLSTELRLRWPSSSVTGVASLRAQSLRPRLYYRMDASAPADRGEFVWPTGILAGLGMRRADLGVLVWIRRAGTEDGKRLLLPVDVLQQGTVVRRHQPLRLQLLSDAEVGELFVRSQAVDSRAGSVSEWAVGAGYYPPGRPIELALESIRTGVHLLQVSATLRNGGATSTEVSVYAD
jgi:hypothetical protein